MTHKTETFEKPNKNGRNKKKLLTEIEPLKLALDSNPDYQCLKITSSRWRPPPRMHSFTATPYFKSSRSFVSLCVCCMLCRMRQSRILQSNQWFNFCQLIFFLRFLQFLLGFSKVPVFCVILYYLYDKEYCSEHINILNKLYILTYYLLKLVIHFDIILPSVSLYS